MFFNLPYFKKHVSVDNECKCQILSLIPLSLFSSHRKNWFAARCKYLHLIKKNSQWANKDCEFFLMRCKYSQRAANQFFRWLEKRLYIILHRHYHLYIQYIQIKIVGSSPTWELKLFKSKKIARRTWTSYNKLNMITFHIWSTTTKIFII